MRIKYIIPISILALIAVAFLALPALKITHADSNPPNYVTQFNVTASVNGDPISSNQATPGFQGLVINQVADGGSFTYNSLITDPAPNDSGDTAFYPQNVWNGTIPTYNNGVPTYVPTTFELSLTQPGVTNAQNGQIGSINGPNGTALQSATFTCTNGAVSTEPAVTVNGQVTFSLDPTGDSNNCSVTFNYSTPNYGPPTNPAPVSSAPTGGPAPDFTLSISPSSLTVNPSPAVGPPNIEQFAVSMLPENNYAASNPWTYFGDGCYFASCGYPNNPGSHFANGTVEFINPEPGLVSEILWPSPPSAIDLNTGFLTTSFADGVSQSVGNIGVTVPTIAQLKAGNWIPASGIASFAVVPYAESDTGIQHSVTGVLNINTNPVNGACGSANEQSFPVAPNSHLCSLGTPSAVSGGANGPWTWSCAGQIGGSSPSCSATSSLVPPSQACSVNLTAQDGVQDITVPQGSPFSLNWTVAPSAAGGDTLNSSWEGAESFANGSEDRTADTATPGFKTYTLTCTGADGTNSSEVKLNVLPAGPSCTDLTYNSATSGLSAGNSGPTGNTLSVNPGDTFYTYVDYGQAGISDVNPPTAAGASACSFDTFNGTVAQFTCTAPATPGAYTYKTSVNSSDPIYCASASDDTIGTVTISSPGVFTATPPSASTPVGVPVGLTASGGCSASYSWSVSPSAGVSPSSGSGSSYNPIFSSQGSYIVTVSDGCDPSKNIPITVTQPSCSPLTANPTTVIIPEQSTLSWNCTNVQSCTINGTTVPTIGGVSNSTLSVTPSATGSTYTLVCTGFGAGPTNTVESSAHVGASTTIIHEGPPS